MVLLKVSCIGRSWQAVVGREYEASFASDLPTSL